MNSKIWLSSPHMGGTEMKYIQEAFDTNWVAPLGRNVNMFEEELSQFVGIKTAAALSSGTGALHLALIILGVTRGDEVICSSFTFSASANPIAYLGATPVFVDSEQDSWNMDPNLLEYAIKDRMRLGKKPKAIVLVHLYGMPARVNEVLSIASLYDIPVVEDAAEALGSCIDGRHAGTFGEIGIFSFNGNKIITTSGGGALVTNNSNIAVKARFLATQARDNAPHYQHSEIGYNYRMSNIVAGIGRGQLEVLESRIAARRANNCFYREFLEDIDGISFLNERAGVFSNYWLTTITIDPKLARGTTSESIRNFLDSKNIETRPLWKPMHMQPIFKDAPSYVNSVSERLFSMGLCLPSGSNLTDIEKERVKVALLGSLKG